MAKYILEDKATMATKIKQRADLRSRTSSQCPHCEASDLVRHGVRNGFQRWLCRPCGKTFTDNGAEPGRRLPAEHVGAAITMFFDGLSMDDIRRTIDVIHDYAPSTATVYEWVRDFSKLATEHLKDAKPKRIGDTWVADETAIKVHGTNHWAWVVMDARTRFILAIHFSRSRGLRDARTVMRKAMDMADGRAPKVMITDGLPAYVNTVPDVIGIRTKHQIVGDVSLPENNNLIERLNGTIKERTKVMRGLQSVESARALLGGWTIHYNYFRDHEGLRNRTPATVAGIKTDVKQWDDVARLDVRPVSHARSQRERKNPGRRAELKKRSDAFREERRAKRGFGTVKPGVFAGETGRKGLLGAPTQKQKRLFT